MNETHLLTALILAAALLYSSVGHGGASGYLAAMALLGVAPEVMKPTALVLNVVVASVATVRFAKAGHFSWSLFWPFAAMSVPCAFLGGAMMLPVGYYKALVGLALLVAAWRLALRPHTVGDAEPIRPMVRPMAVVLGAALGLLAGLTGVGGGIFLSPLLLFLQWSGVRRTAAVSAAFILVNSIAGLAGHWSSVRAVPVEIAWWAPAALVGGLVGSGLGSGRLAPLTIRRMLSLVLGIAGLKLVLA